jgi:hypothetical protein
MNSDELRALADALDTMPIPEGFVVDVDTAIAYLRQCAEEEPVAYQNLFDSYYGQVWREESGEWNGNKPIASRALFTHPAPAQPVPEPLTADDVFASDEIMALNAKAGLRIELLMEIVRAVLKAQEEKQL